MATFETAWKKTDGPVRYYGGSVTVQLGDRVEVRSLFRRRQGVVYFNQKQHAHPTFYEFDPHDPPMELPQDYFEYIEHLKPLGFTLTAHLYQEGQTAGVSTCVTLFTNQKERTGATIVYMLAKNVVPDIYVEFSTAFVDGSELNTNNTANISVFTKMPGKLVHSVPHVKNASELFCIHQNLLKTEVKVP